MFRNCRLARMSDGHYCFVRDLGLVKGGKGMKHHEVVVDFNRRGMMQLLKRVFARLRQGGSARQRGYRLRAGQTGPWENGSAASVSAIARPSRSYRDIG